VYLNAYPAPEKYFYIICLSDTSPVPEKPGKYLKTPHLPGAGEVSIHFSVAGEVLMYPYPAPERPKKPEKYIYTPEKTPRIDREKTSE